MDTATVLAAVAGLFALPVAWQSYKEDGRRSREVLAAGIQNVLTGLGPEMELIRHYATGPDARGYPTFGDDVQTYQHYRAEADKEGNRFSAWLNPRTTLASLDFPAVARLSISPYAAQVGPLVQPFGLLASALETLRKAEANRLAFVAQNASLMIEMRRLWNERNQTPSRRERDFIESVFFYNFEMHVILIGHEGSPNENTLFRAYQGARRALDDFLVKWEASLPDAPRWYPLADVLAWGMVAAAGVIFSSWFWRMIDPLPMLVLAVIRHLICNR